MTLGCTGAATLSACGGGGGGDNSTPVAAASAPAASATPSALTTPVTQVAATGCALSTTCVIALDGDSTNWGVDVDYPGTNQVPTPPAQLMQNDFDLALGRGKVTVISLAVPGSYFSSDLNGIAPNTATLAARLAALPLHADIVISNSQINDQYVAGLTPTQYAQDELNWINTVRAYGAVPIMEEPNPICRSDMNIDLTQQFVETTNILAQENNYQVLPVFAAIVNYPLWNLYLMSSDCVHPNDEGYAFKEANYFGTLLPIVDRMLGM